MIRLYGHFAAAYGTIWFVLMLAAVLTQSRIDAGPFGLFGFPIIAFLYALLRVSTENDPLDEIDRLREHIRVLEEERQDRMDD